jgi:hypothetical protein
VTVLEEPVNDVRGEGDPAGAPPHVDFDTSPERYRH